MNPIVNIDEEPKISLIAVRVDKDLRSTLDGLIKPYDNDELIVNVRYVNYLIDENGNYVNRDKIITVNRLGYIQMSPVPNITISNI